MARRAPAGFALRLGSARRRCARIAMPLALIVCLASSGRPMSAQEKAHTALEPTLSAFGWPRLVEVQRGSLPAQEPVFMARPAQRGSSRDTLKNGAIIGAVVGAVGLGLLGAFICNVYQEEGGASCLSDTLRVAAIGAAIGTGAGVAVDAALTRNAGVTVRIAVRF